MLRSGGARAARAGSRPAPPPRREGTGFAGPPRLRAGRGEGANEAGQREDKQEAPEPQPAHAVPLAGPRSEKRQSQREAAEVDAENERESLVNEGRSPVILGRQRIRPAEKARQDHLRKSLW